MRSDSKLAGPATGGATGRLRAALGAAGPALVAGMLPLLFIPTTVDAYVLPRASLVLLAGCSAALAGLWLPVSLRPSLGVLGPVALAVAAAALLATILSVAPALSFIGSYGRYESLPMRLAYLLSFCLGVWVLRSRRQRWWTVTAFIVGCLVASLEALNQTRTGIPPRPDGNLGHANLLAALVAMALPLVIARSLRTPLWSLCVVPLGGALVATSSRSGWLGAMAGCVLLFPLLASTGPRRGWALAAAAGSVVAAAAAVIASPLGRLHSDTGSARLHVWSDSLAMIWARPLTGWGPESQGIVLGRFLRGDWEPGATFDRIHQLALDLLATQGMLGLVACSAFWALWAWRCWRCLETAAIPEGERHEVAGLLAAWAAFLTVAALNFDWTAATTPVWILGGVAWAACNRGSVGAGPARAGSGPAWAASGPTWLVLKLAGTAAIAGAAVVLALLPVLADMAYYRGDPASAVRLDPLQPRYRQALGEKLMAHHQPAAAAAELETARRLGANDSAALVLLGDAYSDLGERRQAESAYRSALQLNRFDATASKRLAGLRAAP